MSTTITPFPTYKKVKIENLCARDFEFYVPEAVVIWIKVVPIEMGCELDVGAESDAVDEVLGRWSCL